MSDQRSVMKEFRFLDQKRQTTGLSPEEATRYAQLRDLVGPDTAAPPRAGFDVNAAATRLRESLLPGGLRSQVPAADLQPAPEPPPEPEAELAPEAAALEAAWEAQPFAPLDLEPAPAADPLFDPASMGAEVRPQAWNPEAPGYDPSAPYDEAAWIAAGYDPNATYDWSGYSPDGQAPQPEAALPEEAAAPVDEGAPPALADAAVFAGPVSSEATWEASPATGEQAPETSAWDASGAIEVPEEALEEPATAREEPVAEALPFDPNAPFDHAKWFGRAPTQVAPAEPPLEPVTMPELEPLDELTPEPVPEPGPAPAQSDVDAAWAEPAPVPLDLGEPGPEPAPPPGPAEDALPPAGTAEPSPSDGWFDATTEPPPAPPLAFGDYDADARGVPAGLAAMMVEPLPEPFPAAGAAGEPVGDGSETPYQAAPAGASFGEYDETAPAGAALVLQGASLPFDPAAASAIEPGELPEGYDAAGLALAPASLPRPPPGGYDEAAFPADASYGGPEGDSLPGGPPLELGEPAQDWLPEQALEQGFQLASNGSFGQADHPVLTPVPGWATVEEVAAATAAAAPATPWESPPGLDLAAPFDLSAAAAQAEQPAGPIGELPVEELPTLAAEDILEELPPAPEPLPELAELPTEPTSEYAGYSPEPEPEPASAPEPPVETAAAEAPVQGEIPPEIAAAFGDAPAPADPLVAPAAAAAAPPVDPFAASPLFSEPPPATGPAFGAGEPEPILEEAPPPAPEPEPYVEPEPLPGPEAAPQVWIAGSHRVVLHTVDGQVKRGLLVDAALDAAELALQPQGPGAPEVVGIDNVKAIFFMLAPGEKAAAPVGKKVRVTFRDGRQVAGYSPDYVEGTIGFFMIPADTRTNTGRIWVYQAAVRQVAVS